jgi:hypothetical protein
MLQWEVGIRTWFLLIRYFLLNQAFNQMWASRLDRICPSRLTESITWSTKVANRGGHRDWRRSIFSRSAEENFWIYHYKSAEYSLWYTKGYDQRWAPKWIGSVLLQPGRFLPSAHAAKLSITRRFTELGVIEGHSWSQTKDRDHRWAPIMPQAEYDHVYLWCAGLTAGNMFRSEIRSPWLGDTVDSGI